MYDKNSEDGDSRDGTSYDGQSYDGNVTVSGPAQSREAGGLTITKVAVGDFNNNAYLLVDSATGERLLIDAAANAPVLLGLVGNITQVLTTHRHDDHWGALAEVVAATGARTLVGVNDVEGVPVPTDVPLAPGDIVSVGEQSLEVIELVGHTPGSIALLYQGDSARPHLFTGDSLFPGGVGNTKSEGQNFDSLFRDVTVKLFDRLPDETWVYPGHGGDTTLGAERPSLPAWRARGW